VHRVWWLARGKIIPVNKKCPDPRLELESVFRGIRFALIYVFALPVVVAIFVLMAAILNHRQGSLTGAPFPDSCWKNFLSFAFRLSLILGIVYLTSRRLNGCCFGAARNVSLLSLRP